MVKHEVEIETLGECVDEIDKLAELIGKHEADQHNLLKDSEWLGRVVHCIHWVHDDDLHAANHLVILAAIKN
ncbi:hypothetical protein Tco_0343739 [Tanacetum coccineum]